MKIQKKTIVIIILAILFLGSTILAYYLRQVDDYQARVASMTFADIDIGSIPDGKYIGASDVDFIAVKVDVLIQDGKIVSIDLLEHKNGKGEPAEKIIDEMINKQTTDVDVISGATNSCKVIRKAVENALLGRQ